MTLIATGEKNIKQHVGQMDITAAEAIEMGDLVTADGYKADADVAAGRLAVGVALQNADSGALFQASPVAVIGALSGGAGAGTKLYLSDTAGDVAESQSTTNPQMVGVELSAIDALIMPMIANFTTVGSSTGRVAVATGARFAQWYLSFSGTSASEGLRIDISDASTIASGNNRALYINVAASGVKTGGSIRGVAVDFTVTAAQPGTVYPIWVNMTFTGNPALTGAAVCAIGCNMGDQGTGVANAIYCLDLGRTVANLGASRDAFARIRNYGAVAAKTVFLIEAPDVTGAATNLLTFWNASPPFSKTTLSGSIIGRIRVQTQQAGTDYETYYIPLYQS